MLFRWMKLPIAVQFMMLLLAALVLGVLCVYDMGVKIHVAEARNQARTVADLVDNVGTWASQYNGIWVKSDPDDPSVLVGSFLERNWGIPTKEFNPASIGDILSPQSDITKLHGLSDTLSSVTSVAYHRKNPALVQRELSDVTRNSMAKAKFRMTSDRFMNPDNAPTRFELAAIESLRASGQAEYSERTDRSLLYARRLVASAACLKCHESAEKAPEAVRSRYGTVRGFGYREGEIAGVVSVEIPLDYVLWRFVQDFDRWTWGLLGAFLLAVGLIVTYVHRSIIRPVRVLKTYAERAAHSALGQEVPSVRFVEDEHRSRNEVHRLNAAIKALYTSIKLMNRHGRTPTKC